MTPSRRDFLKYGSAGLLTATIPAAAIDLASPQAGAPQTPASTPGAPPAFGTAPPVGPAVTADDFASAEKLVQIEMTPKDRAQAALFVISDHPISSLAVPRMISYGKKSRVYSFF